MQPPPLPFNSDQMPFKLLQINGTHPGREYYVPALTDGDGIQRAILGRASPGVSIDVSIEEPMVSRQHAALVFDGETLYVEHLSRNNPTFVNGQPLSEGERRFLKINDIITLADIELRLTV